MKTAYVVTEGSYSDYHVLAVFEDEADADKWVQLYNQGERWEDARVEEFTFFEKGKMPERVRFVSLWAEVKEDGSVDERDASWKEKWTAGYSEDIPPKGRAVGRTWNAPAWGRGLAITVSARTEDVARKALHDRVTQAKTMVPVPPGKDVNIK